jgi:hypothetical protein
VGFVVGKVALWQVFTEYFGFPCQFSFSQLLYIYYTFSHERSTVSMLAVSLSEKLKKNLQILVDGFRLHVKYNVKLSCDMQAYNGIENKSLWFLQFGADEG